MGPGGNLPARFLDALVYNETEVVLLLAALLVGGLAARAWLSPDGVVGSRWGSGRAVGLLRRIVGAGRAGGDLEPAPRRLIRLTLGWLWILDGLLQAQSAMPRSFIPMVLEPALVGQPTWLVHLDRIGVNLWGLHSVSADAATVFIQVAIGVAILVGGDELLGKLGLSGSIGWGLVVWVLGEGMGDLLGRGATVLSGAPGGALLYVIGAGLLLIVPVEAWRDTTRVTTMLSRVLAWFLIAAAALQGLPYEGFWRGRNLAGVFATAAANPQPSLLAAPILAVERFARLDPVVANGICVVLPLLLGLGILARRTRRTALFVTLVWLAALWWLGMDFGVLGGTGTDPNTAPLLALFVVAGLVSLRPARSGPVERDQLRRTAWFEGGGRPEARRLRPALLGPEGGRVGGGSARLGSEFGDEVPGRTASWEPISASLSFEVADPAREGAAGLGRAGTALPAGSSESPGSTGGQAGVTWRLLLLAWVAVAAVLAGLWSAGTLLLALPSAAAAPAPVTPALIDSGGFAAVPGHPAAPQFTLTNQYGRTVSLAQFRHKVVFVSFLDPVCYATCPVVAEELAQTAAVLARRSSDVEFVAIDANLDFRSPEVLRSFDEEHQVASLANWQFLTGSPTALRAVWRSYGVINQIPRVGMVAHSLLVYVISPAGLEMSVTVATGSPGDTLEQSYATLFAYEASSLLPRAYR